MSKTSNEVIINDELTEFLAGFDIVITAENALFMAQEEFADIRHTGFGASDSSKILNVNPYPRGSSGELLADKMAKYHDDTIGLKASVRMGRELEPFVIDKASKLMKIEIMKPFHMYGKANGLNTNFDGVWKCPDGYIPMEIKLISFFGEKYYNFGLASTVDISDMWTRALMFNDPNIEIPYDFKVGLTEEQRYIHWMAELVGIPVYYYTQLQQQIDFLQAPFGYILSHSTKQWELFSFKVARDERTINALNKQAGILNVKLKIYNS